jgi:hypothetical protein
MASGPGNEQLTYVNEEVIFLFGFFAGSVSFATSCEGCGVAASCFCFYFLSFAYMHQARPRGRFAFSVEGAEEQHLDGGFLFGLWRGAGLVMLSLSFLLFEGCSRAGASGGNICVTVAR